MAISAFTEHPEVKKALMRAHQLRAEGKQFSDIVDDAGYQYVDLVQEGGGVLGIALVGYTYVLEQTGIRFFSLAGTSAGAINTLMMAGLGPVANAKSEQILELLSIKDLFDLVDGDRAIKKIINKAIKEEKGLLWALAWNARKIYRILSKQLGLNPGSDFKKWITEELSKANVHNLADLKKLRAQLPSGLQHRNGTPVTLTAQLAIISSDISTHTKAEFPKMAGLYWQNPDATHPADFVRASMSIPFFFEPFTVNNVPNAGSKNDPQWDKFARYYGEVPKTVRFVDGGMLSNFPINVFHRPDGGEPRMPTFGARLSAYRDSFSHTDSLKGMAGGMISTMRQIYDYDFLLKNPDYRKLICRIDADQEFNWLDFNMTQQQQVELFALGAAKAIEFLEGFHWPDYKGIRLKLAGLA